MFTFIVYTYTFMFTSIWNKKREHLIASPSVLYSTFTHLLHFESVLKTPLLHYIPVDSNTNYLLRLLLNQQHPYQVVVAIVCEEPELPYNRQIFLLTLIHYSKNFYPISLIQYLELFLFHLGKLSAHIHELHLTSQYYAWQGTLYSFRYVYLVSFVDLIFLRRQYHRQSSDVLYQSVYVQFHFFQFLIFRAIISPYQTH